MNIFTKFLDYIDIETGNASQTQEALVVERENVEDLEPITFNTEKALPPGRVSRPDYDTDNFLKFTKENGFITPEYMLELIPTIRKLSKTNEDLGSVFNDLIQLTNTGHNIKFDQSISPENQAKMRKHLKEVSQKWGSGVSGINGLVNKLVGQIWISGALSAEWVPNKNLSGIRNTVLVNPENIRFKYNRTESRYEPYQKIKNSITNILNPLIELNTNTYSYYGILGDTDSPYGIPPFLTALEALSTQKDMKTNIRHIMKQLGLLGYLEVKVTKPTQKANETETQFISRLTQLLRDTKKNIMGGFLDGVVVGFEEDHEFEFHSTTKNLGGVSDIFNNNQIQVANGLKTTPSFLGISGNGTETNMSIVFTKMLSQLNNIQQPVSTFLEKGYLLELQMAGFNIRDNQIAVVFKPSTITDDLKLWQAKEIKQRTLHKLRVDGIIDQDQYAEEMGYDQAHSKEPVVKFEDQDGKGVKDQETKEKREAGKDTSDRRNRDKKKAQPKRKDTNTKPQ